MRQVIVDWKDGKPVYEVGEVVTPSYSRSGGEVVLIRGRYFVPQIDAQYPARWFDTLNAAWGYCESAYYSWN